MKKDKLTKLIYKFNLKNPTENDFKPLLPFLSGEIKDLKGIDGEIIGKFNAIKTLWELNNPTKPQQKSRAWETHEGYKYLVQWSNLVLLRILIKKVIDNLKSPKFLYNPLKSSSPPLNKSLLSRLESQVLDAARSSIANVEEGWKRSTTSEYLQFLSYSQGSLEEVKGDIRRMLEDGLIKSVKGTSLAKLGINLKLWNDWAKDPSSSLPAQAGSRILYFPLKGNKGLLKDIKGSDITYEMLYELTNKSDYLLRRLVESLEKKLGDDRKGYQVEQARIRERIKKK